MTKQNSSRFAQILANRSCLVEIRNVIGEFQSANGKLSGGLSLVVDNRDLCACRVMPASSTPT